MPDRKRRSSAVICCVVGVATSAGAAELCVVCEGPSATYRCSTDALPASNPADTRAQLLCISELARAGGHDRCAVAREASGPCNGPLQIVTLPADRPAPLPQLGGPPQALPAERATAVASPAEAGETEVPKSSPTVAAEIKKAGTAVGESAQSAGETLGKAGDAVGGAAKSTWKCLTSFFANC